MPVAAMYVGIAAEKAGDFAAGSRFLARAVERLREQGRLGLLTQALVHYAWAATYAGDWEAAERGGRRGGDPRARHSPAPVRTHRTARGRAGRRATAAAKPTSTHMLSRAGANTDRDAAADRCSPPHTLPGPQRLSARDGTTTSFRALWPVFDEDDPAFHRFMRWPAVLDLVEAGGRGAVRRPGREGHRLSSRRSRRRSEPPILRAGLACARPLMSDDEHAEALFVGGARRRVSRATRSCVRGRCSHSAAGCVDSGEAQTRVHLCATRSSCSTPWARPVGVNARARSSERPARRSGHARRTLATGSLPRSCRSPSWRPRACRIVRSASGCSSPTAPSDRTCTG